MAPVRAAMAALLAAFLGSIALSGCNTMQGIGEDIEAGGENLQESAVETKKSLD